MNILAAITKPMEMLSKGVQGLSDMVKNGGEMLQKLSQGDLPGAMREMAQVCQGAAKAMEGLGGAVPGMQMNPLDMLKQLMGGGGGGGGGAQGAGGGGGPQAMVGNMLEQLMQALMQGGQQQLKMN